MLYPRLRIKTAPSRDKITRMIIFLIIVLASGCSTRPTIIPETRPQGDKRAALEEVLDSMRRRQEGINSLKGTANILWTKDGKSEGVGAKIFYRKPKQLRFETLGFMGLPTMVLITDENGFLLYLPPYNIAIKDELVNLRLNELLQTDTDITLEDIISSATGSINLAEIEINGSGLSSEKEFFVIHLAAADGGKGKIWVDRESKTLALKEFFDNEGILKDKVVFSDPFIVDGITLHRRIDITKPEEGSTLSISYKRLTLNPALDEDTFNLSLAPEVPIYGWEVWNSYSEQQ